MSFNPNNKNSLSISRNNYEEYFLLYTDDELNASERAAVEAFLIAHPDLKPELDQLLSARFTPEEINLENKQLLLAENMKLNIVDENLLLYIDKELNEKEIKLVEEKIKNDEAFRFQYHALTQTKLLPEKIVYPHKKELYRSGKTKKFSTYWVRIAAAVIILLGMGIFVFTYQQKPAAPISDNGSNKTQPGGKPISVSPPKTDVVIEPQHKHSVQPTVIKVGQPDDATNIVRNISRKHQRGEIKKKTAAPANEIQPNIAAHNEVNEPAQKNIVIADKPEITSQQTINNTTVTSPSITSYNIQTTSPVTAVQRDVVKIDNEKKSSLKGFLRKATRFIERTTNISTTNENNELLIGAVALKL